MAYNHHPMVIVETLLFTRLIKELMGDDEYRSLQEALIQSPDKGEIIKGSGGLRKVRWKLEGRGKSGGVRTLLAYKVGDRAFFVYGFAKNARSNIKADELKGLKAYADVLLQYQDKELMQAVKSGALIEVQSNG